MDHPQTDRTDIAVEDLFPRIQKRALGVALGVTCGGALFLLTLFHLLVRPDVFPLGLLSQYCYGYDLTWTGAFAGMAWGFSVGLVGGVLLGLIHNFSLDVWSTIVRMRADLSQKRDVLDQLR